MILETQIVDLTLENLTEHPQSICFINPETGWAAGTNGKIYKTEDGGKRWFELNSGIETDLQSITFFDENTGWATGVNGIIIKTNDGGNTWRNCIIGTLQKLNSIYCELSRFKILIWSS